MKKDDKNVKFDNLDEELREEVLEYTGKNASVYEKKWSTLSHRKSQISWNWASFLFNLFWFAFRKMNIYAYSLLGVIVLVDILSIIYLKKTISSTSMGPVFIGFALISNKLYFDFVLRKVKKLKAKYPDREERLLVIRKQGGVSWLRAILFVLIVFIYSFSILFVEEEVYYSYIEPKFAEAYELQEAGQLDEALEIYQSIENDNIPVAGIHLNKMNIYAEKGEDEKALEEVNDYLEIRPEDKEMIEIKELILNKLEEKE
ncbi:DUF2628 domain-containing protein [Alkalihalobacillus sp. R86527]|uniref:DUF2628 domain-containing protein n=1 Tax=Alkalihalobacillus sp. R86527 TaxID=3093863 RepID=UPI00366D3BB7